MGGGDNTVKCQGQVERARLIGRRSGHEGRGCESKSVFKCTGRLTNLTAGKEGFSLRRRISREDGSDEAQMGSERACSTSFSFSKRLSRNSHFCKAPSPCGWRSLACLGDGGDSGGVCVGVLDAGALLMGGVSGSSQGCLPSLLDANSTEPLRVCMLGLHPASVWKTSC